MSDKKKQRSVPKPKAAAPRTTKRAQKTRRPAPPKTAPARTAAGATKTLKTISVGALARVEGEGGILIKMKNGKVRDVKVDIFEPPRFFEAFLRGRSHAEAPDITARICGICPVAYQMSSTQAMEQALGIIVPGPIRDLRRLLYCGEWIESHVLHAAMLHLPDFVGMQDAIQLAGEKPELVRTALRIKKIGNDIVNVLGGREIHPINVRVGGFYAIPPRHRFEELLEPLQWAKEATKGLIRATAALPFRPFEQPYVFVSLRHPTDYPMGEGNIVSSTGLNITSRVFEEHFPEEHVRHSNALHSVMQGVGAYHVGPLARFNLNADRLTPAARAMAKEVKCMPPVRNPFKSIIVRSLESLVAIEEAIRIITNLTMPDEPFVPYSVREGIGTGCTEAPRGILYHRYTLDERGLIRTAKIMPPTAQNLRTMEDDLRAYVEQFSARQKLEDLTWQCEHVVRNYDPCISCATHFVRMEEVP